MTSSSSFPSRPKDNADQPRTSSDLSLPIARIKAGIAGLATASMYLSDIAVLSMETAGIWERGTQAQPLGVGCADAVSAPAGGVRPKGKVRRLLAQVLM